VLKPGDLSAVIKAGPKVLIIGQGAHGYMKVTEETLTCLGEAGIEAVCLPTNEAVESYNQSYQEDEAVAAALHLTC
ncbi:MAG: hypothetical protein JSV03_04555, partial [Planctomycetota bacterium]